MNPDEILLSIHPDFIKCPACEKYHNKEKTINLDQSITYVTDDCQCFLCGWEPDYINEECQSHEISKKMIEETYGDIYTILYTKNKFVFTKKDSNERG